MVYNVIGITGSSPEALELVFTSLTEVRGKWEYAIRASERVEYTPEWRAKLSLAPGLAAIDYLQLHQAYGRLMGQAANELIEKNSLDHQVHFIAVYGFPLPLPGQKQAAQLGDGGVLAASANLPVIGDLTAMEVAERTLFPEGAPEIPFREALLVALTGALRWRQEVGGALWAI